MNNIIFFHSIRKSCANVSAVTSNSLIARFHRAVRFSTIRYSMQLCPFPLSEVVNGTKIANRTIPLFWYPCVGVPSTTKGTKRVELNSLQNVDWLTRILRDTRG